MKNPSVRDKNGEKCHRLRDKISQNRPTLCDVSLITLYFNVLDNNLSMVFSHNPWNKFATILGILGVIN